MAYLIYLINLIDRLVWKFLYYSISTILIVLGIITYNLGHLGNCMVIVWSLKKYPYIVVKFLQLSSSVGVLKRFPEHSSVIFRNMGDVYIWLQYPGDWAFYQVNCFINFVHKWCTIYVYYLRIEYHQLVQFYKIYGEVPPGLFFDFLGHMAIFFGIFLFLSICLVQLLEYI